MLLIVHTKNFCLNKTTHERYSHLKNDYESENSIVKGSVFNSMIKSDILVRETAEIEGTQPAMRKLRTSNDSIIDEQEKVALIEGNYMAEMDYPQPQRGKKRG